MQVSLVMFKADGSRREFPIKGDRLVIGRKNTCGLRIPLPSVSREHCEIRLEEDQIRLRDLGSSNGTFHNDTRVQEAELAAGDEVRVGPVLFTVIVDGEPAEIRPVPSRLQVDVERSSKPSRPPGPPATPADPQRSQTDDDLDDPIAALEAMAAEDLDLDETEQDQNATG